MNSISMEIPMEQNDETPPPPTPLQNPQQDYKISNSNDSCSDSLDLDNLDRNLTVSNKQIILIKLVSQEPAIFNCKHEDYRNTYKKDELWLAMSKQVGWSDIYCKNKWKAIRDQYCRELKRTRTNCNAKIKWKYFKHLEFLRPYALSRNYRTKNQRELNPENESADQEESSNTQEEPIKFTFTTNNTLDTSIKTENWSICESSDILNENGDITSQIIMQLTQQIQNKQNEEGETEEEEEHQDDDDDDPIHTFLNIESYFEKELITLVHKNSVLYDISNASYRNTKVKLKVWEQIARKFKRNVRQCRLKWKALRDQYIREHKRLKNMGSPKNIPRWKHYDAMSFLEQFVKERCDQNIMVAMEDPKIEIQTQNFEQEEMTNLSNIEQNIVDASVEDPKIEIPNPEDFEREEMITLPNKIENSDINSYEMPDDDDGTSGIYTERLYSSIKSPEDQEKSECFAGEKTNHLLIEKFTEVTEAQSSTNDTTDSDDEVGAFFKAVAIKIRKSNMSTVAFTELQIDILKVITNALKDK